MRDGVNVGGRLAFEPPACIGSTYICPLPSLTTFRHDPAVLDLCVLAGTYFRIARPARPIHPA